MYTEIILMIILTTSMKISGQQMRPGIIVSKEDGVVNAKDVYFGYLDCNNSESESSENLRTEIRKLKEQLQNHTAQIEGIRNQIQSGMFSAKSS